MAIPVRLALSFPAVDRASSSGLMRKGMINTDALKILRLLRAQVFEDPEERYTALKHLWCPDMLFEALSLALIVHERFVRGDSSFWAPYLSLIPSRYCAHTERAARAKCQIALLILRLWGGIKITPRH